MCLILTSHFDLLIIGSLSFLVFFFWGLVRSSQVRRPEVNVFQMRVFPHSKQPLQGISLLSHSSVYSCCRRCCCCSCRGCRGCLLPRSKCSLHHTAKALPKREISPAQPANVNTPRSTDDLDSESNGLFVFTRTRLAAVLFSTRLFLALLLLLELPLPPRRARPNILPRKSNTRMNRRAPMPPKIQLLHHSIDLLAKLLNRRPSSNSISHTNRPLRRHRHNSRHHLPMPRNPIPRPQIAKTPRNRPPPRLPPRLQIGNSVIRNPISLQLGHKNLQTRQPAQHARIPPHPAP